MITKKNAIEAIAFIKGALAFALNLLKQGKITQALAMFEELKALLSAFEVGLEQYVEIVDLRTFPKNLIKQIEWVARNAPKLIALAKAPDYLESARAQADAFARKNGIVYKVS